MATVPRGQIVFLGNSITEGFDLNRYFPQLNTLNRGIAADHLDGVLDRLDNSALALAPSKLVLMMGINDIGDGRDDAYLRQHFFTLLDTLTGALPDTDILVHSILPTSPRWANCPPDQIQRMNEYLEILALDMGLVYIDLYTPMVQTDAPFFRREVTSDGLHLNDQGYALWASILAPYLTPF